jgi:uncharacterized membrane protein (UPF0182 family)
VIPLSDSILYIEPLYIQAETGQLPELEESAGIIQREGGDGEKP